MLLGHVVFLVDIALEGGEYVALFEELEPTLSFEIEETFVRYSVFIYLYVLGGRRNGKVFELLAKNDDSLLGEEWILLYEHWISLCIDPLLLCMERGIALVRSAIKELARLLEVVQDVVKALWIKLETKRERVLIV